MKWPKLTERTPFGSGKFSICQLCGLKSDDTVEFRLWQECDDQDLPIPGAYLLICRGYECQQDIASHARLYREIRPGGGEPGAFALVCGPCKFRDSFKCCHPDLKANGGTGLRVQLGEHPWNGMQVCFNDGRSLAFDEKLAIQCDGRTVDAPSVVATV